MSGFGDHFSAQADDYAAFRPTYPPALAATLAALAPARRTALDLGTGNGQAARLFAAHFERVIAIDGSTEQLARAAPHPRVEYRVGRAEASGLAERSVELVCAAAAAHWFEPAGFHREVERVLVPGGLLAVWTYDLVHVAPDVDEVLRWFYGTRVHRHWPPGRRFVETMYRELPFPYADLALPAFAIEQDFELAQFLGYVGTWSAVARCRAAEGVDPLPELAQRLRPHWPDGASRRARFPLALRAGRKPAH